MKTFVILFGSLFSIFASSYSQTVPNYVPTVGLVGWWQFSGDASDGSGNNNNGTINGATLSTDRFGMPNSAYYFDGSLNGNSIYVPNSQSFNFNGDISFSLWINTDVFQPLGTWLMKYSGPYVFNGFSSEFSTLPQGGFGARWDIGNGDTNQYGTTYTSVYGDSIIDSTWHNVVGIFTNNMQSLYVDGLLVDTTFNNLSGVGSNTQPLIIGKDTYLGNSRNYTGLLDDIGIWNRALTLQEISSLYNGSSSTGFNPITPHNTVNVFPNPTNDHITIDFGTNYAFLNGYSIRIDNTLGQSVFTSPVQQQAAYINLSSWTGVGVYFIYLLDSQNHVVDVRKIVLQ